MRKLEDADAIIIIGAQPSRDNGSWLPAFASPSANARRNCSSSTPARATSTSMPTSAPRGQPGTPVLGRGGGGARRRAKAGHSLWPERDDSHRCDGDGTAHQNFEGHSGGQNPRSSAAGQHNGLALAGAGIEAIEDVGPWLDAKPLKFLHIVASDAPTAAPGCWTKNTCPIC